VFFWRFLVFLLFFGGVFCAFLFFFCFSRVSAKKSGNMGVFAQKNPEKGQLHAKKCEKKIEKLEEKKNRNKYLELKPETSEYEIPSFVREIMDLTLHIRNNFPYSGKEHHFQAAMEMELRERGIVVSQEVARLIHYKTQNNYTRQLPHDIRGREDLLLPDLKYIVELKQIKTLSQPTCDWKALRVPVFRSASSRSCTCSCCC
jgi:hypothetical protein